MFSLLRGIYDSFNIIINMSMESETSTEVVQHTVNPRSIQKFSAAFCTTVVTRVGLIPVRCLFRIEIQNKSMIAVVT